MWIPFVVLATWLLIGIGAAVWFRVRYGRGRDCWDLCAVLVVLGPLSALMLMGVEED